MRLADRTYLRISRTTAQRLATYGGQVVLSWGMSKFGVASLSDFLRMDQHFRTHFGGARYYREMEDGQEEGGPEVVANELNESTND